MAYKYEMHTHNSISSKCGRFTPRELVETFAQQGYAGIFTTDHFFNGNIRFDMKNEPWKYRLEKYCEGFHAVKAEGDKCGLDVFFGLEYSVQASYPNNNAGCDFLVYGIDEKWLEQNGGDVETCPTNEYLNRIRSAGGVVVQAHPFRMSRDYMEHICLFPDCVDGVEVLNTSPSTLPLNTLASVYADHFGFFHTAGSDIHWGDRELLGVTEVPEKAVSDKHFLQMLRQRRQKLYIKPNLKCNGKRWEDFE